MYAIAALNIFQGDIRLPGLENVWITGLTRPWSFNRDPVFTKKSRIDLSGKIGIRFSK